MKFAEKKYLLSQQEIDKLRNGQSVKPNYTDKIIHPDVKRANILKEQMLKQLNDPYTDVYTKILNQTSQKNQYNDRIRRSLTIPKAQAVLGNNIQNNGLVSAQTMLEDNLQNNGLNLMQFDNLPSTPLEGNLQNRGLNLMQFDNLPSTSLPSTQYSEDDRDPLLTNVINRSTETSPYIFPHTPYETPMSTPMLESSVRMTQLPFNQSVRSSGRSSQIRKILETPMGSHTLESSAGVSQLPFDQSVGTSGSLREKVRKILATPTNSRTPLIRSDRLSEKTQRIHGNSVPLRDPPNPSIPSSPTAIQIQNMFESPVNSKGKIADKRLGKTSNRGKYSRIISRLSPKSVPPPRKRGNFLQTLIETSNPKRSRVSVDQRQRSGLEWDDNTGEASFNGAVLKSPIASIALDAQGGRRFLTDTSDFNKLKQFINHD